MRIPYRTRQVLKRWAITLLVLFVVALLVLGFYWLWLGRYVVYTENGVRFDFSKTSMDIVWQQRRHGYGRREQEKNQRG